MTKIAGNHTIKFGGDVLHLHFIQRFLNTPQFSFTGSRSGNAVADFLLGAYDSLGTSFGVRDNDDQTVLPSFFFQDEWKVKPRFTLTLGLRWEPYNFWHDNHDRINTFQAGAQSTVVPDAPPGFLFPGDQDLGRSFVKSDRSNLAPRLGFAWDVFGNGKTSVRGAYGVFYEGINADSLAQSNAPFAGAVTTNTGLIGDPFGSVGQTPPPSVLTGQFGCVKISTPPGVHCPLFPLPAFGFFLDQSLRTPYIQEWNLTIQRQLTPNIMLETGYIGKIGIKLGELRYFDAAGFIPGTTYNSTTGVETTLSSPQNVNARVPYEPGILTPGSVTLGSDFRSWYHGWMTQVTKRMSHNMEFVASYTLSKAIDMDSSPNSGSPGSNPFYLLSDRGRSDWDRRHAFVASFVWSPIPHFNNPWMNKTFSNWTVTGIETVQSGTPLTFLSGQDLALNGSGGSEHAFLTGDPIALDHSSRGAMVNEFFNTGAFVRGQCKFVAQNGNPTVIEQENCTPFGSVYSLLGQYGNAGRGILSGPALANLDFSVIKDIPITERYKLQFRSEFFNALNQVNFSNPRTTVNSGTFGQIQSARDGRVIQFALKLFF